MKKYILIIVVMVFLGSLIYQNGQNKKASVAPRQLTPTSTSSQVERPTPPQKPINWIRQHYITIHSQLEDIPSGPKKGVYHGEEWIDKIAKKSRFELFKADGTLQYAYVADEHGIYEFDFDPKTKKGKFIQKPNSGRMDFESDKSNSAKEHFEIWKKQIEGGYGYHTDEKLEEIKLDGRPMYRITLYMSPEYNKPKAVREVTLIDKETYLTYQYLMDQDGKKFRQISTYYYIADDFSDEVFTLKPPKGYTLAN